MCPIDSTKSVRCCLLNWKTGNPAFAKVAVDSLFGRRGNVPVTLNHVDGPDSQGAARSISTSDEPVFEAPAEIWIACGPAARSDGIVMRTK
jgi:hypothetical protein